LLTIGPPPPVPDRSCDPPPALFVSPGPYRCVELRHLFSHGLFALLFFLLYFLMIDELSFPYPSPKISFDFPDLTPGRVFRFFFFSTSLLIAMLSKAPPHPCYFSHSLMMLEQLGLLPSCPTSPFLGICRSTPGTPLLSYRLFINSIPIIVLPFFFCIKGRCKFTPYPMQFQTPFPPPPLFYVSQALILRSLISTGSPRCLPFFFF